MSHLGISIAEGDESGVGCTKALAYEWLSCLIKYRVIILFPTNNYMPNGMLYVTHALACTKNSPSLLSLSQIR